MEIITEPQFHSSVEVVAFLREMISILKTVHSCECDMSKGALRVDASVSVRRPDAELGVRAEVKNLNSIKFVAKAIDYEITRQIKLLESGKEVINETRTYDSDKGCTISMRDKEKVHDYRFLPEPNLPPLRLSKELMERVRTSLPATPGERRQTLIDDYLVPTHHALTIARDPEVMEFFMNCFRAIQDGHCAVDGDGNGVGDGVGAGAGVGVEIDSRKLLLNLVVNKIISLQNLNNSWSITSHQLTELISLYKNNKVSFQCLDKIIDLIEENPFGHKSVIALVDQHDLGMISDPDILGDLCHDVILQFPTQVKRFKKKGNNLNFFITKVMQHNQHRPHVQITSDILKQLLNKQIKT